MNNFTPLSALIGGLLIGLAATLLLWLNGRLSGVSGIAGGLLVPSTALSPSDGRGWRLIFLIGLVLGAGGYFALSGTAAAIRVNMPVPLLIIAGLLTGFGTSLGNGCTSGHGVCGLARFSLRSLVATATFLAVAILTTYVARHVLHVTT